MAYSLFVAFVYEFYNMNDELKDSDNAYGDPGMEHASTLLG